MNILVPTDFSNDSYNALFYATQLYRHQECTFHILHTYNRKSHFKEDYLGRKSGKTLLQFLHDKTIECLTETSHRITADTEGNPLHTFITVPKKSNLETGVKEYMSQTQIDLLVMGNKGRTGAKEIFMGGNTIQMVKSNISCPLLCVPKEIDYRPLSQMAYITDYKQSLKSHTLEVVKSVAQTYKVSLHIVHIDSGDALNSSQEKNKDFLGRYFDDINPQFHSRTRVKSKAKSIAQFVKDIDIDLLIIVYHRHYLLNKLFREPVVLDLSFYVETPLLIIPYRD